LTLKEKTTSHALDLGFSFCGFAKAEPLVQEAKWLDDYLERKPPALFDYLSRTSSKRLDPRQAMEDAKTVIVLLQNYYAPPFQDEETDFMIARYAYGKDYHVVIREKLDRLVRFIKAEAGEVRAKTFVDSGPVMEKAWAQRSGTGWTGKNTLLINKSAGSFFFIGIILINLEIEPDKPEQDHCGNCRKCLDACPTGALEMPNRLNPVKCISYWTIENKNEIPDELRGKFHNRIYGCDICQDACPYNKFAVPNEEPSFRISDLVKNMRKEDWLKMTEEEFKRIFAGSPVIRTGYNKIMRTVRSLEDL
jgi:epoxyqueuosine reductase